MAELAAKGVNRIVLGLPTGNADQSLAVMDSYHQIVDWAGAIN
ncbi:MAG: hypothetical protein RIC89_17395 [Pseudomonadales bacterium]